MLVHICCSVDSDYFLKELCATYPKEKITAYFYDPNIHPYSEYLLRLSDVRRSCDKLQIPLIAGEYDFEAWLNGTKGLENEPEKGARCKYCFDFRLENAAKKAKELSIDKITTTLLMSPKKEFQTLKESLEQICLKYEINYFAPDFRKGGGTTRQFENAKKESLYHQNYCGCLYALNMSRAEAHLTELACPISRQIQPASPEQRIKLYKKLRKLEKNNKAFKLRKIRIKNYRLESSRVLFDSKVIPSYVLFNSELAKQKSAFNITQNADIYFAKDNICLLSLSKFNELLKSEYKSSKELYFNAPSLKKELKLRRKLLGELSTNAIIIIDEIKESRVQIELIARTFFSNIEILDC